jgi:methylated-DNA-[protein]-cysteine S-methyltransferase
MRHARELWLDRVESPLGPLLVVTDAKGVVHALDFADYEPRMRRLMKLRHGTVDLSAGGETGPVRAALRAYFAGAATALDRLPIETGGTEFQRSVWQALRAIPHGQTRTYGQLAEAIGRPTAVRAVGLANGANAIAVIVPCHRVIGRDGTLTGYAGGLERKQWLLELERGEG